MFAPLVFTCVYPVPFMIISSHQLPGAQIQTTPIFRPAGKSGTTGPNLVLRYRENGTRSTVSMSNIDYIRRLRPTFLLKTAKRIQRNVLYPPLVDEVESTVTQARFLYRQGLGK